MTAPLFQLTQYMYIYVWCLNIHETHVTAPLFQLTQYMYIYKVSQYTWDPCDCTIISALSICIYIRCLNIHGTHVTATNFTNNNVVISFISDLNIV